MSVTTINYHLQPENTVRTKVLVTKYSNNSLEPVIFKKLDSIR